MIDQSTIRKIEETAQIYDVVSEFVSLKRSGRNYIGLCPFHNDRSPSFTVNPARNICKCFSCGEGGTPISFLMKKESMTYVEALRWLAKKYQIEIEEREMTPEQRQQQTAHEGMLMVNEFAQKTFEEDLYNTPEGRNVGLAYFRERGFQDEIIKTYHLGYALDDRYDLAKRALAAGMKREYLLDETGVGLCYGDDPRKTPVSRFAGRVIFPHHSISGRVVAFGGRILARVDHAFKKYVNSPESAIYHKTDLPYGMYEAKSAISKEDLCYVVEGNFDVLAMAQAGFRNVVAASGTSLTTEHIKLIKRFTTNVMLMFDGDKAGINAAMKSIDLLLLENMNVRLLLFPDGDDPDSFNRKHSPEEVKEFFEKNAVDFLTFKLNQLYDPRMLRDNPLQYNEVLHNVVRSIALIADPAKRSIYVRKVCQTMFNDEASVNQAIAEERTKNYVNELRNREIAERRAIYERERQERKSIDESNGATPTDAAATADGADVATTTAGASNASDTAATAGANVTAKTTGVNTASGVNTTAGTNSAISDPMQDGRMFPITISERHNQHIDCTVSSIKGSTPYESLHNAIINAEGKIIRNVVRYGGRTITFEWTDEQNNIQKQEWRVIDYIGSELFQDKISFSYPLYAKMFGIALHASEDPSVPFDSLSFFNNYVHDTDVLNIARFFSVDRYDALGVASNNEELNVIVPRSILELKVAICHMQIQELEEQLSVPSENYREVLVEFNKKNKIRQILEKELGERVVVRY